MVGRDFAFKGLRGGSMGGECQRLVCEIYPVCNSFLPDDRRSGRHGIPCPQTGARSHILNDRDSPGRTAGERRELVAAIQPEAWTAAKLQG